jgi:hypothetical protein
MQIQTQTLEKKVVVKTRGKVFIASNLVREKEMLDKNGQVIVFKRKR